MYCVGSMFDHFELFKVFILYTHTHTVDVYTELKILCSSI